MGKWALQCKYVNVVLFWSPFMTHRIIIHWIKMTPRSSSMPHLQFENQAQRSVWEDLHQLNITVRRSKYAPFLLNVHAWNYLGTICTTGILLSKADLFAWMPYWSWWSCSSFFYSTLLCLISLLSGWLNIDDYNLFCPQEETIWQIKITQVQRISRSKSKINLVLYLYSIFSHGTDSQMAFQMSRASHDFKTFANPCSCGNTKHRSWAKGKNIWRQNKSSRAEVWASLKKVVEGEQVRRRPPPPPPPAPPPRRGRNTPSIHLPLHPPV